MFVEEMDAKQFRLTPFGRTSGAILFRLRAFLVFADANASAVDADDDLSPRDLQCFERRIFSVREIVRIQSFPDWFGFYGKTVKSKYQQIGNAIPHRLAYEIALNIDKALKGEDLRKTGEYLTFDQFVGAGKPLRACDRDVVFSGNASSLNK